jgi:hypothetical protein
MKGKRQRRMTSRARSLHQKRLKVSFPEIIQAEPEIPPEHTRFIMSTAALRNLLNLVANHSEDCEYPDFAVECGNFKFLKVTCITCKLENVSKTDCENTHLLSVPDGLAAGSLCAGIGYSSIKTLFATMEMPIISKDTFRLAEERIGMKMEEIVLQQYKENGIQFLSFIHEITFFF